MCFEQKLYLGVSPDHQPNSFQDPESSSRFPALIRESKKFFQKFCLQRATLELSSSTRLPQLKTPEVTPEVSNVLHPHDDVLISIRLAWAPHCDYKWLQVDYKWLPVDSSLTDFLLQKTWYFDLSDPPLTLSTSTELNLGFTSRFWTLSPPGVLGCLKLDYWTPGGIRLRFGRIARSCRRISIATSPDEPN